MAIFNPDLPGETKEKGYAGYSEGIRPEREVAGPPGKVADNSAYYKAKAKTAGMENYGNILKGVIDTADWAVKTVIDDKLRIQKTATDNEFGVGAAATTQNEPTAVSPGPTPQGIENAASQVEGITAGYQSGRLKESHYWARLESIVRATKARFPGYENEIDAMISRLAGATPANALRNSLQAEASAGTKETDRHKLIDKTTSDGSLYNAMPDFDAREKSDQPYTESEILSATGQWNAKIAKVNAEKSTIARDIDQGTLDDKNAIVIAKKQVMQLVSHMEDSVAIKGGVAGGYRGTDGFITTLNKAQSAESPGGAEITADEQMLLSAAANHFALQARLSVNHFLDQEDTPGTSWRSILKEPGVKEVMAPVEAKIAMYTDALANKDYGYLSYNANKSKALTSEAGARLLDDNKSLLLISALRDTGGETAVQMALTSDNKLLSSLDQTINTELSMKSMVGKTSSLTAEFAKWQEAGIRDPRTYNAALKDHVRILTDATTTPEVRTNLVEVMFGDQNLRMIARWGTKDPQAQLQAYKTMTSPDVLKTMETLKASDPASWNKYRSWVGAQFQVLFRQDIIDAKEAVTTAPYLTLGFDPKTGAITYQQHPMPKMSDARLAYNESWLESTKKTVTRINEELKAVTPILASDQIDPAAYMIDIMTKMGLDPHMIKTGSLYDQILNAVYTNLHAEEEPSRGTRPGGGSSQPLGENLGTRSEVPVTPVTTTTIRIDPVTGEEIPTGG